MHDDTKLTHAGREHGDERRHHGVVNTPVYHASTVTYPSMAAMKASQATPDQGVFYGRMGTPTTFAFQDAMAALEGGGGKTLAVPSGLAACTTALLATCKAGDHALVVDTVYAPVRRFCEGMLKDLGVSFTYFAPHADIRPLLQPNTKAVYLEAPGSMTFEMQDVPALAKIARAHGALTMIDNTWATPLYFKPLAHGVDISIHSVTKYIGGHSDLLMGTVTAAEPVFTRLRETAWNLGLYVSPDDCYLALRGLRTLSARMARHQQTGLRLANWLRSRPSVQRVIYPALPGDPGHLLWQRDFTGAPGLFAFVLQPGPDAALAAMLDHMKLFALGYSWGGFESLIVPFTPGYSRSATQWTETGALVRISAGLEDAGDLIADLEAGLARFTGALAAAPATAQPRR